MGPPMGAMRLPVFTHDDLDTDTGKLDVLGELEKAGLAECNAREDIAVSDWSLKVDRTRGPGRSGFVAQRFATKSNASRAIAFRIVRGGISWLGLEFAARVRFWVGRRVVVGYSA